MTSERTYRGRRLAKVEWGLWRDVDRPGHYLLDYRPAGARGPRIRRWAYADGLALTPQDLRDHVRAARARISARKAGVPLQTDARASLDAYVQDLQRGNRSPRHVDGVRRSCERLLDATGVQVLQDVSTQLIQDWLADLRQAVPGRAGNVVLSPRTLNKHRGHLRAWLNWALRRGSIDRNPVDAVAPARRDERLREFPRPLEMLRLVRAAPTPWDAGCWTLLALTGLRLGAFCALTPEAWERGALRVPPGKRRREWLMPYEDGCPLRDGRLRTLGRRVWGERAPLPDAVRDRLARTSAEVGARYTPHALRHAFASWLSLAGESYQDIAAWGHWASTREVERTYAHLRPRGRARQSSNRRRLRVMVERCYRLALRD